MRKYLLPMVNQTIAGAATLLWINPGATRSIEIVRVRVSQRGTATSERKAVQFVTQVSAFPTLTSTTPVALDAGAGASAITGATNGAAGTCGTDASAEGAGAKTTLEEFAFDVVNGFEWIATSKDSIILNASGSSGFGVYLPSAPTSLTNWSASLVFIEH